LADRAARRGRIALAEGELNKSGRHEKLIIFSARKELRRAGHLALVLFEEKRQAGPRVRGRRRGREGEGRRRQESSQRAERP